ncbi:hypothetical protein KR018_000967 [Drosophila ironensis]|nr:hypothetical protein KR018_000967 [Drosophila ironensis]
MRNGSWHHPFCNDKYNNLNPDTNGANGCMIHYYNNETMAIWDVRYANEINGKRKLVQPPIFNMTVKFTCHDDYAIMPFSLIDEFVKCYDDKTWSKRDFHPTCNFAAPRIWKAFIPSRRLAITEEN